MAKDEGRLLTRLTKPLQCTNETCYLAPRLGLAAQLHEVGGQAAVEEDRTRGVRTQNGTGRLTEGGRPSGRDSPPLGGGTLSRLVAAAVVSVFCRREEKKSPVSLDGTLVKAEGKGPTLDQCVWTSVEQPRATNDEKNVSKL